MRSILYRHAAGVLADSQPNGERSLAHAGNPARNTAESLSSCSAGKRIMIREARYVDSQPACSTRLLLTGEPKHVGKLRTAFIISKIEWTILPGVLASLISSDVNWTVLAFVGDTQNLHGMSRMKSQAFPSRARLHYEHGHQQLSLVVLLQFKAPCQKYSLRPRGNLLLLSEN